MSVAQPTVVGDQLIATSSISGRVMAFPVGCTGDLCPISWKAAVSGAITPVASADVVFVASPGGTLAAYDVHCATGGATCHPSWTWSDADGESPPAIDGSRAFVVTRDWRLVAFGIGNGPRAAETPSPELPIAVLAIALLWGTISLIGRRRKKAKLVT